MLDTVEALFVDALGAGLGPGAATLVAGPSLGPADAGEARVEVWARALAAPLAKDEEIAGRRSGATFWQRVTLDADGSADLTLPPGATGEVVEVESPAGRPLARGDAYLLAGSTLRFYTPPAHDVVVLLRGGPARGFVERRAGEVSLSILVWTPLGAPAEPLTGAVLASTLGALVDMPNLSAATPGASGARLRLLRPAGAVTGVARTREIVPAGTFLRAAIDVVIRGELEQAIALGAPEPAGTIAQVERVAGESVVLP